MQQTETSTAPAPPAVAVADAIIEELRLGGVTRIYGMPGGGSNMVLIDAALRGGIEFILAHHETAAVFMAAGEAEVAGTPGVCLSTVGPGVANSVNGLAHCTLDCVPLILISDRADEPRYLHQAIDHAGLVAAAVKRTEVVGAEDARSTIRRALADATAPPAGAVHLDLAPAIARATSHEGAAREEARSMHVPLEGLSAAQRLLRQSARPLIIAGVGARDPRCVAAVRSFSRSFAVPVLTTYKAKGVIPESDALAAGLVTNGAAEGRVLGSADTLLCVGFDTAELLPGEWNWPLPTVMVGNEAQTGEHIQATVAVKGDPALALAGLADALADWGARWGGDLPSAWIDQPTLPDSGRGVAPAEVVSAARAAAPEDAIATIDAGSHMLAASLFWKVDEPNRFLISNSLATMGYSLPAAIGASLAKPDRPVVCFTGDGGLAMVAGELATAARLGVHVVVVVFNDAALNLIKIKQERRGETTAGLTFDPIEWSSVAEGFGIRAASATTTAELDAALAEAFALQGPTLIDVQVDPATYPALLAAVRG